MDRPLTDSRRGAPDLAPGIEPRSAVLLSSEFPPGTGGIGTHAYNLAVQLHQRGWQISVASLQEYVSPAEVAAFNARQPFPVVTFKQLPTLPGSSRFRSAKQAGAFVAGSIASTAIFPRYGCASGSAPVMTP